MLFKWLIGVAAVSLLVYLALPVLENPRSHGPDDPIHPQTSLKHIGVACLSYFSKHNGNLPPDLATLCTLLPDPANVLRLPHNRKTPCMVTNVEEWSDYVYIPGIDILSNISNASSVIVAYLPPGAQIRNGETWAVVLFADCHIERLSVAKFTAIINKGNPTKSTLSPGSPAQRDL